MRSEGVLDESPDMPEPRGPTEWGRRIRAALVLRTASADDLARELNLSPQELKEVMDGKRPPRGWETARVCELLRIPDWFLLQGLERESTPDELLKTYEVAEILSVSRATVLSRFEVGVLPGFRLFGKGPVRFRRSDLEAVLEEWRVPKREPAPPNS